MWLLETLEKSKTTTKISEASVGMRTFNPSSKEAEAGGSLESESRLFYIANSRPSSALQSVSHSNKSHIFML